MRFVGGLILAVLLPAAAAAQTSTPSLRAARLTRPLTLDGQLNEPIYTTTPATEGFVQQEPFEGQPGTERTEVWVLFDDAAIYVSARLWESVPGKRVTSDMQRDSRNLYNNDHFGILLDTFNDRRNGYYFYANAQGGMQDGQLINESPNNNWNGLWDVRAANFPGGWSIEFRIPFRSVRFTPGGDTWGINFRRMVRWKNEITFFSPIPQSWGRRGLMKASSEGTVTGLVTPSTPLTLDLKPFATGTSLTNLTASPAVRNELGGDFGGDLKLGLGQNVVADFTYNTDFAQVEDDEAQVNLTRFSVFFPEKRDFFLEGQDYFNFAGAAFSFGGGGGFGPQVTPVLFYSRRIGIAGGQPVPIRGGGRVLARGGGFQFGVMHLRTAEAPEVSEPARDYSVVRLNRDLFTRSRIGLIATRRADASQTAGAAYAYGADASLSLSANAELSGYWARTEADGVARERLTGTARDTSYRGRFELNADGVGLELDHLFVGDRFDPAIGFLRRDAFRRTYAKGRLSPRPTNMGAVRKMFFEASADYYENAAGQKETATFTEALRLEMKNTDRFSLEALDNFERLDAAFDLGNGVVIPAGTHRFSQLKAQYEMSTSRPVSGFLSATFGDFYDGTIREVAWRGRVEFSSRLYAEPTISRSWIRTPHGNGTSNLYGSRATLTMTPRLFVAALVQYRSSSQGLTTNARLRWEYQPGSELFVVYSDGRSTADRRFPGALENRSLVVKITKLLRK